MGMDSTAKRVTAIGLALLVSSTSLVLFGGVCGYAEGLIANVDPELLAGFSAHGPNFFDEVARSYLLISFCSIGYQLTKLFHQSVARDIGGGVAQVGIVFLCARLLLFKYDTGESAVLSYRYWLDRSFFVDWAIMIVALLLIGLEMRNVSDSNRRRSENGDAFQGS